MLLLKPNQEVTSVINEKTVAIVQAVVYALNFNHAIQLFLLPLLGDFFTS